MKYYVYILRNPIKNNKPFYVGKGSNRRCHFHTWAVKNNLDLKNPHKDRTIRQILESLNEPIIDIVFRTNDEREALDEEKRLIKLIGRENLTNLTDGGEKNPMSDPTVRETVRLLHLGRKRSKETKQRLKNAAKNEDYHLSNIN